MNFFASDQKIHWEALSSDNFVYGVGRRNKYVRIGIKICLSLQ